MPGSYSISLFVLLRQWYACCLLFIPFAPAPKGAHNLKTGKAVMHVWDESVASRGAEEVASCLLLYCTELANSGVTSITAYSDACGGQNRNYKLVLMWMHICKNTDIEEINHKFMVSGHSYLPNDSDFGIIEKATRKASDIFIPGQWCTIIEKCNKKNPFSVIQMNADMFKSVKELSKAATIRKTTESGDRVEWLKIQWIKICKAEPNKMFFKYTVQDDVEFSCVNFSKKGRTDRACSLSSLYPGQSRALSADKIADIMKLLKYVPPIHHDYYKGLKQSTAPSVPQLCEDEILQVSDVDNK